MPTTLKVRENELFAFPQGLYRFREIEEADDSYLFMRVGKNGRMYKTEEELVSLLDANKVIRNPDFRKDTDGVEHPVPQEGLAPDEEESEAGMRARTFQFYVQKWDDDPVGKGNVGLAGLIAKWSATARQKKLTWPVEPARLRHAINKCGEQGRRPIRAFLSGRGKTKRQHFDDFIEASLKSTVSFYFSERKYDYNDAYGFFTKLVADEKARRKKAKEPPLRAPATFETLRRRITKAICHATWMQKYSKHEADQKFNGTKESLKADKPLELVIMDHTTLDAWTVLDDINYVPYKRPTLTFAIDVATRMPLGYSLGDSASLHAVLRTLKHVNKSKSYVKERYKGINGAWDGWGHPETILVDRGLEFVSPTFQDNLSALGTEVMWAPVANPEFKAIGERFFRTLNTQLVHKLEGAVPYDTKVLRLVKIDPRTKAILTLSDLDRLLHQCIIEVYQNERHAGIGAIPARIWKEKIEADERRFMDNQHLLDGILSRTKKCQLTRSGIRLHNMRFHDSELTTKLLNELVSDEPKRSQSDKTYGSSRVSVIAKWNDDDASQIEVWPIRAKKRFATRLPNVNRKFSANISFRLAEKVQKFAREHDMAFRTDEQKWLARNRLRELGEMLAGILPRGQDFKDFQRAQAEEQAALAEGQVETARKGRKRETEDEGGIPLESQARERRDEGRRTKGKHRAGAKGVAKAKRTIKAKREIASFRKSLQAESRRANMASGADPRKEPPAAGGNVSGSDLLSKLDWMNKGSKK